MKSKNFSKKNEKVDCFHLFVLFLQGKISNKIIMKVFCVLFVLFCFLVACENNHKEKTKIKEDIYPEVSTDGKKIVFKTDESFSFFKTNKVSKEYTKKELKAIGRVGAISVAATQGNKPVIVLFESPELTSSYIDIIHHQINISQIQNINIKQRQIELERVKDLVSNGAATGKDLLDAQMILSMEKTNLANEKAGIVEHEVKLKANGFNPDELNRIPAGIAYIICHIPENQITKIQKGTICQLNFASFPNEDFEGKIEDIADVVDNTTRMLRMRVIVNNPQNKLKAGMFVSVAFDLNEGNFINISKNSLVTIQGKDYVFLKKDKKTFTRKEVKIGQQIEDRIIILSGLNESDEIATEGVLQLKGLSFGY